MSTKTRGRRRRTGATKDEKASEDPIPSVGELVVSTTVSGRIACVLAICDEASKYYNEVPLTEEAAPTEELLDFYEAKHPCFAFARFAVVFCAPCVPLFVELLTPRFAAAAEELKNFVRT